jgi:hypothetical protein
MKSEKLKIQSEELDLSGEFDEEFDFYLQF